MLKSLFVRNFRGLECFDVPKLGRVNLIVGKNNSGKSSVLEALRIYADNANLNTLNDIASSHNEKRLGRRTPDESEISELPFQSFFSGWRFPPNDDVAIQIGEAEGKKDALRIEHVFIEEIQEEVYSNEIEETVTRTRRIQIQKPEIEPKEGGRIFQVLKVNKNERDRFIWLDRSEAMAPWINPSKGKAIPCRMVPTGLVSQDDLARIWDRSGLTDEAVLTIETLKIISKDIEGLQFVENSDERLSPSSRVGERAFKDNKRIAIVKVAGAPGPVPISSFGDGVVRVLQVILSMFQAKGGVLLIDEFENGLHYSVQEKIWSVIFDQAKLMDVQVFATTHSWDCIDSFTKVAGKHDGDDAVLFRVGRSELKSNYGKAIATVFDGEQLKNITQADLEVR